MPGSNVVEARYRIERPLGRGGGGDVLLAEDTVLGRQVALKSLRDGDNLGLTAEARILAALRHPNIVQVFDVARVNREMYLVLEYVPGRNLREVLEDGPLPAALATEYTVQVARALACAHREGIVHNDVKPENIIIDRGGAARLTDFGVASIGSRTLAPGEAETIAGSLPYIAPELIQGAPPGARSDLYSLAVTLYELVTGELPYPASGGATLAQRLSGPPPGLRHTAGIWPGLATFLERALSPSPAQRHQDADSFADDLERFPRPGPWPAASAVATRPRLGPATQAAPPRHRRPVLVAVAATAIVALAAGALAMTRGGADQAHTEESPTATAEATGTALPTSTPVPPTATAQPAPTRQNVLPPTSPPKKNPGNGNGKKKD